MNEKERQERIYYIKDCAANEKKYWRSFLKESQEERRGIEPGLGVDLSEILKLTDAALYFLRIVRECFNIHEKTLVITSLISDRKKVKAKSRSHGEGRAFDIRTMGVDKIILALVRAKLEGGGCAGVGALAEEEGKDGKIKLVERPIVGESHGNGPHWHIQVRNEKDLFKNF